MRKAILSIISAALLLGCLIAQAQPWLNSPNPMAKYYQEKGWPAWSDAINWNNKINMATYTNGNNDFEKFENARDQLAAQGGGVLYYPTGTYDFSNHPTGPNAGRGLMLKSGVVILGDEPQTDTKAIVDSVTPGLNSLGTKFIFPFIQVPGLNGAFGEVPEPWNMIGLYADTGTRVSEIHHVGIAWVNLVGAYVYMGPDMDWSTTWGALNANVPGGSYRKARWSIYPGYTEPWNNRVPNGQHPGDAMFGAIQDGTYYHSTGGRFIFGCRFDHSAVTDNYMELYKSSAGVRNDSVDNTTIHNYRFSSRINMDGANLFVANNALPKSNKNFYYDQKIQRHNQVVPGSPFQVKTILFDYAKAGGIDVNKSLITRTANRCNYLNGPLVEPNVVIKDNYVFSHGHKGYELAGKWMIVQNNVNDRIFLGEGDDIYNLGPTAQTPSYELTLDGVMESGVNSDNMSRAFDMAGWCVWTDKNWYQGTGSVPGNDGEGILYQTQGGVGFLSVAETYNRQGATGKDGYIAPWDVVVYGMFQGFNRQRGAVGLLKPDANRVEDAFAVENYHSITGAPSGTSGLNGTNVGDLSFTCPTGAVSPPSNVQIVPDTVNACIKITWDDNAFNEVAFRIDRRPTGTNDWVQVAYRPANVTGSFVSNFSILDLGNVPTGCANQGPLDLNPQEWWDYLAVPGASYEYRVVAINCANDDQGAAPIPPAVTFPTGLTSNIDKKLELSVYPNPAWDAINLEMNQKLSGSTCRIIDINGREVARHSIETFKTTLDVSRLKPGMYSIILNRGGKIATTRFVKR